MAWRWTARATCTSPVGLAASARWTPLRASLPQWPGTGLRGSAGTAGRPPLRNCPPPQTWRWTGRATSTSPIRATAASARWTPLRASFPRSRGEDRRWGTAGRPPLRSCSCPASPAWRWTARATCTSPVGLAASARWTPLRASFPRSRGEDRRWGTAGRPPLRNCPPLSAWRWMGRATSTSPIRATAASARWTSLQCPP